MLDLPWHTYVALVMQDHQYNSPVVSVFYALMSHSLSVSRRERALRKMRVNVMLVRRALVVLKSEHEEQPQHLLLDASGEAVWRAEGGVEGGCWQESPSEARRTAAGEARTDGEAPLTPPRLCTGTDAVPLSVSSSISTPPPHRLRDSEAARHTSFASKGGETPRGRHTSIMSRVSNRNGRHTSIVSAVGDVVKRSGKQAKSIAQPIPAGRANVAKLIRSALPDGRHISPDGTRPNRGASSQRRQRQQQPPVAAPAASSDRVEECVEELLRDQQQQRPDERSDHLLMLLATVQLQELRRQKQRSRRRALNRWHLALMLIANPSLQKLRRRPAAAAPPAVQRRQSLALANRRVAEIERGESLELASVAPTVGRLTAASW